MVTSRLNVTLLYHVRQNRLVFTKIQDIKSTLSDIGLEVIRVVIVVNIIKQPLLLNFSIYLCNNNEDVFKYYLLFHTKNKR